MDLKSMLNDSSSQRPPLPPRLHTPRSSLDQRADAILPYDPAVDRPPSYHPPPPPPVNGSSFAAQSPRQHSAGPATTPGVTPSGHVVYAQSPTSHGPIHTPREGPPSAHPHPLSPFGASPSPSAPQPHTPGSGPPYYQTPTGAGPPQHPGSHPGFNAPSSQSQSQSQSPRDDVMYANGNPPPHAHTISPPAPFQTTPVTPLGPPGPYHRPSPHPHPHPHRPISQGGQENQRRLSVGSVGSSHSRDHPHAPPLPPHALTDHSRSGSFHRSQSGELRERERSIESVSPKTIPRPPPQRRASAAQHYDGPADLAALHRAQPPGAQVSPSQPLGDADKSMELQLHDTTPLSAATPVDLRSGLSDPSPRPSPGVVYATAAARMTPQSSHSSLPAQPSPSLSAQPTLKRNASHLSSTTTTPQPPRKRPRRDEVPLFARSGRVKQLRFIDGAPVAAPRRTEAPARLDAPHAPASNGQVHAAVAPDEPKWEPSIMNMIPYEDLTRKVSDWVFGVIGMAPPLADGAVFEIEAKIGAIVDEQSSARLSLPIDTEAIFNKDKHRGRTSFQSSMDMAQHKMLNNFLNDLVQDSVQADRELIYYDHPQEYDEFYNLTDEGKKNLSPSILAWLNPRHKPKVRRTIDERTGQVKTQIIKTRIADLEVYNPGSDFDYRISVSIESPWDGDFNWLAEMTGGGRDRKKDRMSYRHLAYQIDLTQVSHPNSTDMEHELEVEISTEWIRIQLANLREQRPSRYEDLIRGFLDNVRILCRRGSMGKAR